jgi:hypothetical protein
MTKTPMPNDQAMLVQLAQINGSLRDILIALQALKESFDKIANRKP